MTVNASTDRLKRWAARPDIFVRELFGVTPDPWQDEVLRRFPTEKRIAMVACAGPGKTAVLSWLSWNFLLTRPDPLIMATAISGDNLSDNLWREMARWRDKSPLLTELFEWQKESIFLKAKPDIWVMNARRWSKSASSEQQGNTLRGRHAKYIMAIIDESGGIPQPVVSNAENIGAGAIEWHIVQAGNPTNLDGPLYLAATQGRGMWWVTHITADPDDPNRTPRVSVEHAREQIAMYGADNPWVLVNIFGRFPPASMNSLIGPDEVNAVLGRHVNESAYAHAPRVLGVDVARFGDDKSVIFPRQGVATFNPIVLRNATSGDGAAAVAMKWNEWLADACFIDGSGGWSSGWQDSLASLGRDPVDVQFAGRPNDPKFLNKRAEMWWLMCAALKNGTVLPRLQEIVAELTVPTYTFKGDKIMIEEKEQIKARLGRSPDFADALALTYAQPVHVTDRSLITLGMSVAAAAKSKTDYNPYERG